MFKLAPYVLVALLFQANITVAKRREDLTKDGKFIVEWEVSKDTGTVVFDLTVETIGFVGFGLSSNGGMGGADIVIGGVLTNGTPYFSDRHGPPSEVGNGFPEIDSQQDWTLSSAFENGTHTTLTIERALDTCDLTQDLPITEDTIRFIWAVGPADDTIAYHGFEGRGAYAVSILGEPYPELDLTKFESFEVTTNLTLPSKDTTYWCTVHRTPGFASKQHAVAFGPELKGASSEKHSHHLSIYSCTAPEGEDPETFFDRFLDQGGIDCLEREPGQISAYPYCTELIYTWTIGGRTMLMPEDVGFPIGEKSPEFYLMESHLDNPEMLEGITFETGVRVYYTSELRVIEAGVIRIYQMYDYNFVVPPVSKDYLIVGHCSSNCTAEWIPEAGVDVFNIMLHSHAFGRKMKLRHFRGREELPCIINDDNYDNKYQDNRNIQNVKLLPGDQLAIECQYDNSLLDPPGTVVGGFSTREEMCEVVSYYYPRTGLENCRSNSLKTIVLDFFGIESVRNDGITTNPLITGPEELAGRRFLEYLDSLDWTESERDGLESLVRYSLHEDQCGGDGFQRAAQSLETSYITYPDIETPYAPPPRVCGDP